MGPAHGAGPAHIWTRTFFQKQHPEEKIDQVFKTKHDKTMMRKIIKESKVKLEKMHSYLEGELEALN